MIGSVSASRRVHAFAQALDEHDTGPGEGAAEGDHEQARLLTLASELSTTARPALDPEVKSVQRAQLVAAMEAAAAEGTVGEGDGGLPKQRTAHAARGGRGAHRAPGATGLGRLWPRTRLGKGIAAGGLSVGVAATAFGGVAAASEDALPGDTLYGFKRGMEDLQLDLADDDADRGEVYLDHASTRLREARRLMERGRAGDLDHESLGEIRRALSGMQHDAAEGHRLLSAAYERHGRIGTMQSLSAFTEHHRSRWVDLQDRLPMQLADVGQQVSSVFDAIEDEVGPLRALFPTEPEGAGSGPSGSGDGGRQGGTTTQSAAPSSQGASGDDARRDGRASPSESGMTDDGLLDDGGLLDPSAEPSDSGGTGGDTPAEPAPDVTLPPLLPEVLPGLGVDSEE